ncbi:arginase [Stereum hirsutum FP-91666 SS1]|uniref:arginase n=1 Tax=Stereum hirsutum (strain FP-91666) TaxID=721885 RepID=UPI000440E937|nr:arginase [Stereum hirsutum FP-91666 SS1]EIM89805.1 arginase [Stereum hirsutum FP-91666 SS1]
MASLGNLKFISDPKTVAIVGCPFSGGQPKVGVDEGPIHLVDAGLVEQLTELGWQVKFDGHHQFEDISAESDPPIGKLKNPRLVSKVTEAVAKAVGGHAQQGQLPLTLGGDHSLAMGTIAGTLSKYPDACVIWIDAHTDINTPETTDSGNIHGMPLAFLCSLADSSSTKIASSTEQTPFEWLDSVHLDPSKLAYIGLRDIDAGEKAILRKHNIAAFSMHEVDRYGIGQVVEMAIDRVNPGREKPIHLSFDVDALDPTVAPSTGTPVRGGLTFREGHYICERLFETGLLVAVDLMEVNPSLKDAQDVQATVAVGCSLVRAALGETLL